MSFVPQSLRRVHRRKTPLQAYKESRQRFFRPYRVSSKALNYYVNNYQPKVTEENNIQESEISMSAFDNLKTDER